MSETAWTVTVAVAVVLIVAMIVGAITYSMQRDRDLRLEKIKICAKIDSSNLKLTCIQTVSEPYRR